jgi:hypothetical protein
MYALEFPTVCGSNFVKVERGKGVCFGIRDMVGLLNDRDRGVVTGNVCLATACCWLDRCTDQDVSIARVRRVLLPGTSKGKGRLDAR